MSKVDEPAEPESTGTPGGFGPFPFINGRNLAAYVSCDDEGCEGAV
jgi:hypothetical protein